MRGFVQDIEELTVQNEEFRRGGTQGLGWSWTGKLSLMWEGWAESFRTLEQHEDSQIREIGRIGRERRKPKRPLNGSVSA